MEEKKTSKTKVKKKEAERLEINETEISIEEKGKEVKKMVKKFWVLVGKDKLYLYANKNKAVIGLREELPDHEDATIAEIVYTDIAGKGTFNVEGVSWKDIALGWVSKNEDEE